MPDETFALAAHKCPAGFTRRRLLGGFVGGPLAGVFGRQAAEADRKRQSKRHDKHPKRRPDQGGAAQRGKVPSKAEGGGKQGGDLRALKVLTRNLYFGADLQPILQATSFPELLRTVAQTFAMVQATNFPERAQALADEIAAASPHLVGLQEATIWRRGTPVDVARWTPGTPAETVEYDFLAILLAELAARGMAYAIVARVKNTDAQAPGFAGAGLVRDVRLTDHDVLLARTDLPDEVFAVGAAASGNFAARVTGSLLGTPIEIPSGWTRTDVRVRGRTVRIVETHLEPLDLGIQELQRAELAAGPLATAAPTVLMGDLNSPADRGSTYRKLLAAGFADAWTTSRRRDPGFTWGHAADLRNPEPTLTERIDFVLTRGGIAASSANRVGHEPEDRTPSGLWPSDHAGVWAVLHLTNA
jgi:endonuclease/exonuclease/phosphatase family metal-dependent hydrolase